MKYVGEKTERVDGRALVKGKAVFADALSLPDMLHLKVLRSPHAHAKIVRIDGSGALTFEHDGQRRAVTSGEVSLVKE